jgi:hypothetical protein
MFEAKLYRHIIKQLSFLSDVQICDDGNVIDITMAVTINVAYVKRRVGLKALQSIITKKAFVESVERNGPSWRTFKGLRKVRNTRVFLFYGGTLLWYSRIARPLFFYERVYSGIEQDGSRLGDWDEG